MEHIDAFVMRVGVMLALYMVIERCLYLFSRISFIPAVSDKAVTWLRAFSASRTVRRAVFSGRKQVPDADMRLMCRHASTALCSQLRPAKGQAHAERVVALIRDYAAIWNGDALVGLQALLRLDPVPKDADAAFASIKAIRALVLKHHPDAGMDEQVARFVDVLRLMREAGVGNGSADIIHAIALLEDACDGDRELLSSAMESSFALQAAGLDAADAVTFLRSIRHDRWHLARELAEDDGVGPRCLTLLKRETLLRTIPERELRPVVAAWARKGAKGQFAQFVATRKVREETGVTPVVTAAQNRPSRDERKRAYVARRHPGSSEAALDGRPPAPLGPMSADDESAGVKAAGQEDGPVRGSMLYAHLPPPEGVDDPVLSAVIRIIMVRAFVRPTESGAFGGGRTIGETSVWRLSQAPIRQAGGNRKDFKEAISWLYSQRVIGENRLGAIFLHPVDQAKPAGATLLRAAQALKMSVRGGQARHDEGRIA